MRDQFEPELMLEVLLKFFAHKDQELQDFDCVFSQMKVVNFDEAHDNIECVEFQHLCEKRIATPFVLKQSLRVLEEHAAVV
jgi:hypothetical protein